MWINILKKKKKEFNLLLNLKNNIRLTYYVLNFIVIYLSMLKKKKINNQRVVKKIHLSFVVKPNYD